jgi:hypothetical protein
MIFNLIIHEFEDFFCSWPLMAFIGLDWPFGPLLAFWAFIGLLGLYWPSGIFQG